MPATDMTALMRSRRKQLNDYMYQGSDSEDPGTDPTGGPADESPEPTFKVVEAGQPTNEDENTSYVYEPFEGSSGAWVVYPPGVPCDEGERRIVMDHPATPDEYTQMAEAIKAGGKSKADPESAAEDAGEAYA